MAWSTSNVNAFYTYAMGTNAVKPSTDSFNVALYNASVTPVQSTTASVTQYAGGTWLGNEITGTGYTGGGKPVTPISWVQETGSPNIVQFTSSGSPQWTAATFTTYGCLVYDTTVNNQAIGWMSFSGAQSVTSGTFTISWSASGIVIWTH